MIKSQVANITRPLAATSEVVDARKLVAMHERGGIMKQMSAEDENKVTQKLENASGPMLPVTRKGHAFHVEMEIKQEEKGWSIQRKKNSNGNRVTWEDTSSDVEVDQVICESLPCRAFWEQEVQTCQRRA